MDWFRWHHGSVTDPKFQLIAKKADASVAEVVAVWAFLLETASQNPKRGTVEVIDGEALDLALGMDDGTTLRILCVMAGRGLIAEGRISAWDKRQPKREDDTAAERQRIKRQREHELALAQAGGVTSDESRTVTQCHAASRAVTPEEKREEKKDQKQDQKKEQGASATRLPADWSLSPAWLDWTRQHFPHIDPLGESERFRDYWIAQGGQRGRKADWPATWRNWCRNVRGSPPQRQQAAPQSKQVQALHAILGTRNENNDGSRVVLDINPAGLGADLRAEPKRLTFG